VAAGKLLRRPRAVLDLEDHSDFLYEEAGFEVGMRFLESADQAFDRLLGMPHVGAPRAWLNPRLPALRMWPIPDFPNHLIWYQPTAEGIEVVRVLNAARDIERVISDE